MITIYEKDATDFSTNGLGTLDPTSCEVHELLNGTWEVTLTHPIDEFGKWQRLALERIIRVPVPAGRTPAVTVMTQSASTEQVKVYQVSGVSEEYNGVLNLRTKPNTSSSIIGSYDNGTKVIRLDDTDYSGSGYTWYNVSTPDGRKGYMLSGNLSLSGSQTVSIEEAVKEVMQPKDLREQPFRIYSITPGINELTVKALHISYDLIWNTILKYEPAATDTADVVFSHLGTECIDTNHKFSFYSDLTTTAEEVVFENVNPIDAMLSTFKEKYGGELARDWYDIYMVNRVGRDTDYEIRYGKNLLALSGDINDQSCVTYIIPVGTDKDGNVLYFPDTGAHSPKWRTSQDAADFAIKRYYILNVDEAKQGDDMTKEQCYAKMEKEAQKVIDYGCDAVAYTLNVDFINLPDTEEYRNLRNILIELAMGDGVRIIGVPTINDLVLRMTEYTYDCLLKRYKSMSLGIVEDTLASVPISASQLPVGGISSKYIGRGAVGLGQIGAGAIVGGNIAANSITAGKIDADNVKTQMFFADDAWIKQGVIGGITLQDGTVKAQALDADTVDAKIANIADARIDVATIDFGQIQNVSIGSAQIAQGAVGQEALQEAIITDAYISSASADRIKANKLMIAGTDGVMYQLNVVAGQVVPEAMDETNSVLGSSITPETITTQQINVNQFFANDAVIGKLDAYLLRAGTIVPLSAALGDARQVLLGTKKFFKWSMHQYGTNLNDGTVMFITETGAVYPHITSPLSLLPQIWKERKITLAVDLKSANWADTTGSGVFIAVGMSNSDTVIQDDWHQSAYIINSSGKWTTAAENQVAGATVVNNVWHRVQHTFTLPSTGDYKGIWVWIGCAEYAHFYIQKPKLEYGNLATSWDTSVLDEELYAGTKVTITEDEFAVRTETFEVKNSQTEMSFTPSGLTTPVITADEFNGPVMQTYTGSTTVNIATMPELQQLALDLKNKYLTSDVTVNLTAGDYTGLVVFENISGAQLRINGMSSASHSIIYGYVIFRNCTSRIMTYYVDYAWSGAQEVQQGTIRVYGCLYVAICDAVITARAGTVSGWGLSCVYAEFGSKVNVLRTEFCNSNYAALANSSSIINFGACKGTGTIGSVDRTGICTVNGNSTMPYPHGSSVWTYTTNAIVLGGTPTLSSGGSPTPVVMHEYPITCEDSRNVSKPSNSDYYNWLNTNTIWQGAWWDAGVTTYYRGVLAFAVPAIAGTVQSVSLTLHRNSGGTTGKANFRVYALTSTYETGSGKTHGAGRNTSAVLGSGSVSQGSDITVPLTLTVTANSTVYLVIDYDESSVQTGYSESANTAVFARGATLTINTKE